MFVWACTRAFRKNARDIYMFCHYILKLYIRSFISVIGSISFKVFRWLTFQLSSTMWRDNTIKVVDWFRKCHDAFPSYLARSLFVPGWDPLPCFSLWFEKSLTILALNLEVADFFHSISLFLLCWCLFSFIACILFRLFDFLLFVWY